MAETTLGLMLLVVAGLLLRSFHRILSVDPGMNPHNVLTLNFDLPDKAYNEQQQIDFYTQLLVPPAGCPRSGFSGCSYAFAVERKQFHHHFYH